MTFYGNSVGPYRVTGIEVLICQHKAANRAQNPYECPVYQLRSLLGV